MLLSKRLCLAGLLLLAAQTSLPLCYAEGRLAMNQSSETGANVLQVPTQILKTGVVLNSTAISANSIQLAKNIGLTPILERIEGLRSQVQSFGDSRTLESLSAKQDLWDATQKASLLIQKTNLEIDFTLAEIDTEDQVYREILATFTNDRDKAIARTNAVSFITNGALWAVTEALAIPTYKNAKFAIPSGIIGIPAGVVPSVASMWTLKQLNGKKKTSEVEPNMLAKLFNYPTNSEIEYPRSVWLFLNQVPASDQGSKKRIDQLIDRWIADANMPGFTDRKSKKQLDVLTASVAQRKGLSISTLTARSVMLQQLNSEVMKMKRMLLELTMIVQGEKQLTAGEPTIERQQPRIGMQ